MEKYLGVEVKELGDDTFELSQHHLIERIIEFFGLHGNDVKLRDTPVGKPLLNKDLDGVPRIEDWNYRAAVGMMNYLVQTSRPDLAMAVHQCARYNNNPMLSHEKAVKRIAKYLKGNIHRGIVYKNDKTRGLECYVDADFAGNWDKADSENAENYFSRTGYVIMYTGCPLVWARKLQTEVALSTAESEYIALSTALREVIPAMNLMRELNVIFPVNLVKPGFCLVHEDNQSCIAMANSKKMTPRTKHIALKYHHFKHFVERKFIRMEYIDTKEQLADIFTKPLPDDLFQRLRLGLCGW